MTTQRIPFLKAHGTGNDFVVISGLTSDFNPTAEQVAAICDRHLGIGADGLLRVARASEFGAHDAQCFMDYRNADGSVAETCGNGLRVFARYLVENQLESPGSFKIGTRAGTVTAHIDPNDVTFENIAIEMGLPGGSLVNEVPKVTTEISSWPATAVFMPNPHCVAIVEDVHAVGALHEPPHLAPREIFPSGANVEFIAPITETRIAMRTFERGVGETLSCGSGACAAAHVWATKNNLPANWSVQVDVLGGTVHVDCHTDGSLILRGPAEFVADGYLIGDQWQIS
ncbi:MAG: diaminopimelate epimerase [Actinobacteria bacterium]|nr:diaminopimelate epimerase [Actinomycetota bacterium]